MQTLDTCGLYCPEPVMMLHSKMDEMAAGEQITVRATDPSTRRDFGRFCQFLGHELLSEEERDGVITFVIQKVTEE